MIPEARARAGIDRLLAAAGWHVCDYEAAGVIEAKKGGRTLTGVERQSARIPAWARPLPFAYESTRVDRRAGQRAWTTAGRPKSSCTGMCGRQTHFTNVPHVIQ